MANGLCSKIFLSKNIGHEIVPKNKGNEDPKSYINTFKERENTKTCSITSWILNKFLHYCIEGQIKDKCSDMPQSEKTLEDKLLKQMILYGKKDSVFTSRYYVNFRYFVNTLHQFEVVPLYSWFLVDLYYEWALNFIKCFLCIGWYTHVI